MIITFRNTNDENLMFFLFHHISRNKDNIFMYIHKYASWIRYCSRSDMYTFAYVYANTQSGYLIKLCHSHVNEIKHLQIDLKKFPPMTDTY